MVNATSAGYIDKLRERHQVPELKLVMMKSSKDNENASNAAPAIPGITSGNVTRRKVSNSFAYRSIAACSSLGSRDAMRAFTVTTTKDTQNMMWAITVVKNPGLILKDKNIASSDAPKTISGVAIGKKIKRLVVERPLNEWRPSAKAISVPSKVAKNVEINPIFIELPSAVQTSGAPQGFCQLAKVKPRQTKFDLPESLKEKAKVYAIGINR